MWFHKDSVCRMRCGFSHKTEQCLTVKVHKTWTKPWLIDLLGLILCFKISDTTVFACSDFLEKPQHIFWLVFFCMLESPRTCVLCEVGFLGCIRPRPFLETGSHLAIKTGGKAVGTFLYVSYATNFKNNIVMHKLFWVIAYRIRNYL